MDASGAVTIAGRYSGAVDFGGPKLAEWGAFAAQLDERGDTRWIWAEPKAEFGATVATSGGGFFLSRYRIPVTKLDANGQTTWTRAWAGAPWLPAIAPAPGGGYALVWERLASETGPLDLGAGPIPDSNEDTSFVAVYAADGSYQWDFRIATPYPRGISRVAVDKDGNVWLGGVFIGAIRIGEQSLQSDGSDIVVAKIDPKGHVLALKLFGSSQEDVLNSLDVDPSGRVVLTGSFERTIDFGPVKLEGSSKGPSLVVAKLHANGDVAWARAAVDGDDSDEGRLVRVDPATSAIWLAGTRRYHLKDESRWFIAKLAP